MVPFKRPGALYLKDNRCTYRVWALEAVSIEVRLLVPEARVLPLAEDSGIGIFSDFNLDCLCCPQPGKDRKSSQGEISHKKQLNLSLKTDTF
jgi:hypothetical protein